MEDIIQIVVIPIQILVFMVCYDRRPEWFNKLPFLIMVTLISIGIGASVDMLITNICTLYNL